MYEEFGRQVGNLIEKGYHNLLGFTEQQFRELLIPLLEKAEALSFTELDIEQGKIPFIIVIRSERIYSETAM